MPGMRQSSSTSSKGGRAAASFSMASGPELTVATANDIASSDARRIIRAIGLSSTTRTRIPRRSIGTMRAGWLVCSGKPTVTVKVKVLPMPGVLCREIVPPISSTSCLLMASPSPLPPNLRVVELSAWTKGRNSLSHPSLVMPSPVSRTEKRNCTVDSLRETVSTDTTTSPLSVNFTALPTRLSSTRPSRMASPASARGTSAATWKCISRSFSAALPDRVLLTLASTGSRSNGIDSISTFPASIFEKSRMSLMIASRSWADDWILLTWSRCRGASSVLSTR